MDSLAAVEFRNRLANELAGAFDRLFKAFHIVSTAVFTRFQPFSRASVRREAAEHADFRLRSF